MKFHGSGCIFGQFARDSTFTKYGGLQRKRGHVYLWDFLFGLQNGRKEKTEKKNYDAVQKDLESYPDVFADMVNVLVYEGRQVLKPENLWPAATESLYKGMKQKLKRQMEDVAKYDMLDGKKRILYLIANQSRTDRKMILRKKGYEGGAYREQYDGKVQDLCPVMELVLYWGRGHWGGAMSLREMFADRSMDPQAWEYIDDGRLHVFEMCHLPPHVRQRFTSDMRFVAEYLADEESLESMEQEVWHLEALLDFLGELSGDGRYQKLMESLSRDKELKEENRKGGWKMCKLMDKYWEGGRREGLSQGISQGISEGISQGVRALIVNCRDLKVGFDETAERVKSSFQLEDSEVQSNMRLYW